MNTYHRGWAENKLPDRSIGYLNRDNIDIYKDYELSNKIDQIESETSADKSVPILYQTDDSVRIEYVNHGGQGWISKRDIDIGRDSSANILEKSISVIQNEGVSSFLDKAKTKVKQKKKSGVSHRLVIDGKPESEANN